MSLPNSSTWASCRALGALLLLASAFGLGMPADPVSGQSVDYDLGIQEHIFENGLRLLVVARPDDPRVACKIFTDFGAIVELPGELGSAHFLEHLMFKGTPSLGTRDWSLEAPLQESIDATERALVEERNRARNELRQRGVFQEYQHAASTPKLDSLQAEIDGLSAEVSRLREHGAMMRWYQAFGGTGLTATTEQEYMKFDINLPRERVELFLRVEADRMRNSVFREFDEERMILVEQRLGDLNRPSTPFREALNASVGTVHPVFYPEGHPTDFYQYTRGFQRDLYEQYFVPNNTTLVFVGGVTLDQMVPLVERWFGSMARQPEPTRSKGVEPLPRGERRLTWRASDLSPRVDVRHMIPGVGHPDRARVDVLAELLGLEVRAQLATAGINATTDVNTRVVHETRFGIPGSLNIEVVTGNERSLAAAERAVVRAIDRLRAGVIPRGRLELAKKLLRTQWFRTAADADALAFQIGHFQTMDRWQTLEAFLIARERTTQEEIQRVAAKYLFIDNRTTGVVIGAGS